MKKFASVLLASSLLFTLAACTDEKEKAEKVEKGTEQVAVKEGTAALTLDHTKFHAENWKADNSHFKTFKGTLLVEGIPVVGAEIQVSDKRTAITDKNGLFTISVDANIIEKDTVHIKSLDNATLNGKKLNDKTKKGLLSLKQDLTVFYPISITEVKEDPTNAENIIVSAQANLFKDEVFPKFGVEKFRISGTILDANGKPVVDAVVNIRRDGVEGFTMSTPSDKDGNYEMFYIPEDDESHYLNVYVPSENKTYTLPDNKAFYFPDDFGIHLEIGLPKEGTVIKDEPPTLVAESNDTGALHKGVLIGLHTEADYTITVPEADGSFTVTLPKKEWDKKPAFYQMNYNGYNEVIVEPGDTLPKNMVRLPDADEPDHIQPTK